MKRFLLTVALLLLCALALTALSEGDPAQALKAKHENTVLSAMRMVTRYACDDVSLYTRPETAQRQTRAWEILSSFDGGWFTKCRSKIIDNLRTDNWTWVSDTEFCVDAYCDFTCTYTYNKNTETFACGYHFCFHQTDARKDVWQFYDFHNLLLDSEVEYARALSEANEGITVNAIAGPGFVGYMTVIDDPSRVFVGTIDRFGSKAKGLRIDHLVEKYGAIGGINGSGFSDAGGVGSGGQPFGLIVSRGQTLNRHQPGSESCSVVIGFDEDDKLIVGSFKSVDKLRLRDAMAFNYALVQDGVDIGAKNKRKTHTTRTAIGQDAEGRVLMLIIKGRQPNSLGASFADMSKVMLEYGAVNAANLDGGTSTCFYLGNGPVYSGYRLDYSRNIPAGFLIAPLAGAAEETEE